jgi:hypothetical protein
MILVRIDHPYLRVGCHRWCQSIMGVIHRVRPYFRKLTVRKHLYGHIRTIVVYFLHLLSSIYYSVAMHRQKDKKINILLSGDVNPEPIPSRRGLLEDSPYYLVGATCLSCDWSRPRT